MDKSFFSKLNKFFRNRKNKTYLYSLHVAEAGCGPQDGTCFILAKALTKVFPGSQICLLSGWTSLEKNGGWFKPIGHHFLVKIGDDAFLDSAGVGSFNEVCRRWKNQEQIIVTKIAPLTEGETLKEVDLMQTIRDDSLIQKTYQWLAENLMVEQPNENSFSVG